MLASLPASLPASWPSVGGAQQLDECTETLLTPPGPGTPTVDVDVDVLVLLDGVPLEEGRELLDLAARAYEPLAVHLRADFEIATLGAANQRALMQEARALLGGAVPAAYDAVHVLSTKPFPDWGSSYCIGGIADPRTAFSTSRPRHIPVEPFLGTPFLSFLNDDAVTVAHELGHLMGARHEMANCVEGLAAPEHQPCTVMTSGTIDGLPKSLRFSSAGSAVIAAHAHAYAAD